MKLLEYFNSQLWALRIVMFCWFAATACLIPYMTIHMRQLGISVEETALVYTVLPFIQVIGSPIAGFIADKMGNYKTVLCLTLITSIASASALMFIPSSGDPKIAKTASQQTRHMVIFSGYFIIRVFHTITVGIVHTLLDATALVICEKENEAFGKVRFWAILGQGLFSPICGLLVDRISLGLDEFAVDYSPTFYFFNLFTILTFLSSIVLDITVSPLPKNLMSNVRPLLKSSTVWFLLVMILLIGTCWGFVESFLFWYLLDLKAPKFLLGLTLTTGALISLPVLMTSEWFIKRIGHVNLMILAFVFYFIRFCGYSLIESPYWCFPFEAMEVVTYHLMWTACATYSAKIAPEGMYATIIGVTGSMHYGIGRAAGSMVGGSLISLFDSRRAFRYVGIASGIAAVVHFLIYYTYVRHHETIVVNSKTKPETGDVELSRARKPTLEEGDAKLETVNIDACNGKPME